MKALSINLHEEEQVDYLLRHLAHMEILNGIKVEREALFENSDEEEDEEKPNQYGRTEEEGLQFLPSEEAADTFERKQSA